MAHLIAVLSLGFFLGVRHATDADHVLAVTTIVSRERTTRAALLVGLLWGLGHSATILLVGGSIIAFGLVIPSHLGLSMEMSVAIMLVILGAMNMTGALRAIGDHAHSVDARAHSEKLREAIAPEASSRRGIRAQFIRPVFVGIIHGLAGSAGIALLVLATISEPLWALVYLGVFGIGTIIGMVALTAAIGAPLATVARSEKVGSTLVRVTGLVSITLGLFLAYRVAVLGGLFMK